MKKRSLRPKGVAVQINLLEYLEGSVCEEPSRLLYRDENCSVTVGQARALAKRIALTLCPHVGPNEPVVILADKNPVTPILYFATLYAGCYYVPVSTDMPAKRRKIVFETVGAKLVLTDCDRSAQLAETGFDGVALGPSEKTAGIEGLQATFTDEPLSEEEEGILTDRLTGVIDTDPACMILTSGSTGTPKGVLLSHRSIIDYVDGFSHTFSVDADFVFGAQAPLDYVAAIRDLYLPLRSGGHTVLIPQRLFSTPVELFRYLTEAQVNTLCWVSSAFALCSELRAFSSSSLPHVKRVFFTGSVLPSRHLRVWQENLPAARFVNHYGPTEITASCTYHVVDHLVEDDEVLPIGRPFSNTRVFLVSEGGTAVASGEKGEICVAGTCLATGYFRDPAKTCEAFVANPLRSDFIETMFKTGDIGSYDTEGVLWFHGRADSMVKHMGHRVELGDIEAALGSLKTVGTCRCLYDQDKEQLWLFHTGSATKKEISLFLREQLPPFMIPRKIIRLEELPTHPNGKIDVGPLRHMMSGIT